MGRRRRKPDDVLVVDARRQFVGYATPAEARRAIRGRYATLFRANPPAIMLPPNVDSEGWRKIVSTSNFESNRPNVAAMAATANVGGTGGAGMTSGGRRRFFEGSWHRFFEQPRDVWIQNVSGSDGRESASIIAITLEATAQYPQMPVTIPLLRQPFSLDHYGIPFERARDSRDFQKIATRQPPVFRLMEEEEAFAWYEQYAKAHGLPSPQAALEIAVKQLHDALQKKPMVEPTAFQLGDGVNFAPPKSMQELMNLNGVQAMAVHPNAPLAATVASAAANAGFAAPGAPIYNEEQVAARVLQVCAEVSMTVPEGQRRTAEWLMNELELIEPSLSVADLEHIQGHGTYRAVKRWARDRIEARAGADGDGLPSALDNDPRMNQPRPAPVGGG